MCECGGRVSGPTGSEQVCRYCGKHHHLPEGEREPPPPKGPREGPVRRLIEHLAEHGTITHAKLYVVAYPDLEERERARAARRHRSLIKRVREHLEINGDGVVKPIKRGKQVCGWSLERGASPNED